MQSNEEENKMRFIDHARDKHLCDACGEWFEGEGHQFGGLICDKCYAEVDHANKMQTLAEREAYNKGFEAGKEYTLKVTSEEGIQSPKDEPIFYEIHND